MIETILIILATMVGVNLFAYFRVKYFLSDLCKCEAFFSILGLDYVVNTSRVIDGATVVVLFKSDYFKTTYIYFDKQGKLLKR